jgi:hypothetical protein
MEGSMKIMDTCKALVGSVAVYAAFAACTADYATSSGILPEVPDAKADSETPKLPDQMDGARLRAHYRIGEDWSRERVFNSWFDRELNVDCSFMPTFDGNTRCVPTGGYTAQAFSDEKCTNLAVFQLVSCSDVPKYAYEAVSRGCKTVYKVHQVMESKGSQYYVIGAGQKCLPMTDESITVWSTAELDLMMFVGSRIE